MSKKDELVRALLDRGFELVSETASGKQLRLLGRVDKNHFGSWILVVLQLLTKSEGWSCDVSKQYVANADTVRYGWRLIFQAPNVEQALPDIVKSVLATKRPTTVEVQDQLLPGYRDGQERGGVNARGKGVSTPTKPMVGPAAIRRLNNGGQ